MELRQLRYFVAVAEELHFGRAARRIGISQPPLSEQIRHLETRLGLRLFERTRRRVELTAAGRILLGEARRLIEHADRVQGAMRDAAAGRVGEIRVGAAPTALFSVLPRLLQALTAHEAEARVVVREAHTSEILERVLDHEFDAGIVWEDEAKLPLRIRPLERVEFIAALPCGHRLADAPSVGLRELARDPLIVPPRAITPHQFDRIVGGLRRLSIAPAIAAEVRSVPSQLGYVVSGFGVALVPRYATAFAPSGVVFKPLEEHLESTPLSLVWNERHPSPQLDVFLAGAGRAFPSAAPEGSA